MLPTPSPQTHRTVAWWGKLAAVAHLALASYHGEPMLGIGLLFAGMWASESLEHAALKEEFDN